MNRISFIILLCHFQLCNSQVGGGGGLWIRNIYDSDLKRIELPDLKIEQFALDTLCNIHKPLPTNIQLYIDYWLNEKKTKSNKIYFEPNDYVEKSGKYVEADYFGKGINLKHKGKSYRFDFIKINPGNPNGDQPIIDSLVLFKPYILTHLENKYNTTDLEDFYRTERRYGVTPYAFSLLSKVNIMSDVIGQVYMHKDFLKDYNEIYEAQWSHNFRQTKIYPKSVKLKNDFLVLDILKTPYFKKQEKDRYEYYGKLLSKVDSLINKYTPIRYLIHTKAILLVKCKHWQDYINLYENSESYHSEKKMPSYLYTPVFSYHDLLSAYCQIGKYDKALKLIDAYVKETEKGANDNDYYDFEFDRYFIKLHFLNQNVLKEIKSIKKKLKRSGNQSYYDRMHFLKGYAIFKFKNKKRGLKLMVKYDSYSVLYNWRLILEKYGEKD